MDWNFPPIDNEYSNNGYLLITKYGDHLDEGNLTFAEKNACLKASYGKFGSIEAA